MTRLGSEWVENHQIPILTKGTSSYTMLHAFFFSKSPESPHHGTPNVWISRLSIVGQGILGFPCALGRA